MKKYSTLLLLLFVTMIALAQPGKKKEKEKEKPPTQKEMEELMKEAQKAMDEMSPEDKKMMDSLGIKTPSFKNVPKVSDKQLAEAWEDENRIVPKKDDARIAGISKTALSAASLKVYIGEVHNKIVPMLGPNTKSVSEKIYSQLKAEGNDATAIGNCAAGLWMAGYTQPALYIMGRVITEDVTNTDNVSNYSSMLIMCAGEHKAIPVLNYLNAKFPGNSTILNNLGQAWFGLGDMTKAEKYLDSTIRIYALHPQANYTKSFIEEGKGDHTKAADAVKKSMQHSYSKEKEERLRKMGQKFTAKDVQLPPKTKNNPLNLGGFTPPPFPKSVDECIAMEPQWVEYQNKLTTESARLEKEYKQAMEKAMKMYEQRLKQDLQMVQASQIAGSPQGVLTSVPLYAERAYLKLNEATEDYKRKMSAYLQKAATIAKGTFARLTLEYETEMSKLREEDDEQTGEGKPNKDFCPRYKAAADKYLGAINPELEKLFKEGVEIDKNYLDESAHWKMYSEWPEKFEAEKLALKIAWLGIISGKSPFPFKSITEFKCKTQEIQGKPGKLAEFDDVACQYHSELNMIFAKMKADCSRFTTEVDAKFVKLGLKQNMDKDNFADQFMSCTVEVKAKIGGDKVNLGPLAIGAKAEAGMGVEIDRTGVKDVYVIGGVKAQAGVLDTKFGKSAGFEGKISIISGNGSFKGTGMLKGIR